MKAHFPRPIRFFGILLVAVSAGWPIWAQAATPFVNEIADDGGLYNVGVVTSLAIDSQGEPHIAYGGTGGIKYASKSGASWTIETVATMGSHPSLALDAKGNPHIAFEGGSSGLTYAVKTSGVWTFETVDVAGVGPSLALDEQGNPQIAYGLFNAGTYDLVYARRLGGGWSFQTLASTGYDGRSHSLALTGDGNPRISYYNETNGHLLYAFKNDTVWSYEDVCVAAAAGDTSTNSLALDAQGNPHISFFDHVAFALRYARKTEFNNNDWEIESVDALGDVGYDSSIAIDAQGYPHISYQLWIDNASDLKYASRSDTGWTTEKVDIDGNVGYYTSLALDAQGNPRISHYDFNNHDLRYADAAVHVLSPRGGERWGAGSVQTVSWSGAGSVSIQLSEDGGGTYRTLLSSVSGHAASITVPRYTTDRARVRISRSSPYSTSDSPCYFSIAPGLTNPWWTRIADDGGAGNLSARTSLALDIFGVPHISYHDVSSGYLKYTKRVGGTWEGEVVDGLSSNVGDGNSLALDAQGEPHISYYDATNGALKYVWMEDGVWQSPLTLDDGGGALGDDVGRSSAMAIDAQGNVHICYLDKTNYRVKYIRVDSGVPLSPEVVATAGASVLRCELALDSRGDPHVGYSVQGNDVEYTRKTGGSWTLPETVNGNPAGEGDFGFALDAQDSPNFVYERAYGAYFSQFEYIKKIGDSWTVPEVVDFINGHPYYISLALDEEGNPRVSYLGGGLKYAVKSCGTWKAETVATTGGFASLALDDQGIPHISYAADDRLEYVSMAVELGAPAPGVNWPVGASRTVTWDGTGSVDLYLSTDGGDSWQLQERELTGGSYRWIVPHTPTKFAQVKLERAVPASRTRTAGFFTIETDVTLLALSASREGDGVVLTWETDPGPTDLAGYRLERAGSDAGTWRTIVRLTRETSVLDPDGGPGSRYRLFAVNGLGEELLLGETSLKPARLLAAWPLPYRGGYLTISFATYGGLGGGKGPSDVSIFDIRGRLVRTVVRGSYGAGYQTAVWDGRDSRGHRVAAGVYLLRMRSAGQEKTLKVAVLR